MYVKCQVQLQDCDKKECVNVGRSSNELSLNEQYYKNPCSIYIFIRIRLCIPLSWINQPEDLLISGWSDTFFTPLKLMEISQRHCRRAIHLRYSCHLAKYRVTWISIYLPKGFDSRYQAPTMNLVDSTNLLNPTAFGKPPIASTKPSGSPTTSSGSPTSDYERIHHFPKPQGPCIESGGLYCSQSWSIRVVQSRSVIYHQDKAYYVAIGTWGMMNSYKIL